MTTAGIILNAKPQIGLNIFSGPLWRTFAETETNAGRESLQERFGLTRQQARVARLLAQRRTIADALCISPYMVWHLPEAARVRLVVYDVLGREGAVLVNRKQEAGRYEIEFGAQGLPSGMYLYRLQTDNYTDAKRLILAR